MRREGLDSQLEESTRELSGIKVAGKVVEDSEEAAELQEEESTSCVKHSCIFWGSFPNEAKKALETCKRAIGTQCYQN